MHAHVGLGLLRLTASCAVPPCFSTTNIVKPLIHSSSEAPFTCCGLPTSHHLPARCYPWQATPLHHRWRISSILYSASIAEMSMRRKKQAELFLICLSLTLLSPLNTL